ncbi:unnamed protein product [Rangifer tarandus platyrhynchus]|uniref:Uncharacterized protein n=1 Tax=Rangifer tarandus platyrhynchus TaxID=3082113 RepID=A0AC59Y457_RANTA
MAKRLALPSEGRHDPRQQEKGQDDPGARTLCQRPPAPKSLAAGGQLMGRPAGPSWAVSLVGIHSQAQGTPAPGWRTNQGKRNSSSHGIYPMGPWLQCPGPHADCDAQDPGLRPNTTSPSLGFLVCNQTWPLTVVRLTRGRDEAPSMRPGTRASCQGLVASGTDPGLQEACLLPKLCSRAATQRWAAHTKFSKQSHSGEVPGALRGTSCPFSFWTGFPQLSPTRAELAAHAVVEAPLEPRPLQGPGVPPAEQEDGEELSGQGQFDMQTHTTCAVS